MPTIGSNEILPHSLFVSIPFGGRCYCQLLQLVELILTENDSANNLLPTTTSSSSLLHIVYHGLRCAHVDYCSNTIHIGSRTQCTCSYYDFAVSRYPAI